MKKVAYNDKMSDCDSKGTGDSEMCGAALSIVQNQVQEKPHLSPEEAGQENDSQSREEIPGEVTFGEASGGSGWRVMTNPITMEKIANFLSDKDLVALCLASKTTKKIIDQMDSSCWRKRALKLEAVLRLDATSTAAATDPTSYKERFLIFKPKVERLANTIRTKIEDNSGYIKHFSGSHDSEFMSLQELAITASLIHHGMLGDVSCKSLCLLRANLSSIPIQQLGSLAACVTDQVSFGVNVIIPDLGFLLDKVKSGKLAFLDQTLGTNDTLALVRAMETRVRMVILLYGSVDARVLRNYDGKGLCQEVFMMEVDSVENMGTITEEDMRQLAQTINWEVTVIETSITIHRSKLELYEEEDSDYEYDEDAYV